MLMVISVLVLAVVVDNAHVEVDGVGGHVCVGCNLVFYFEYGTIAATGTTPHAATTGC